MLSGRDQTDQSVPRPGRYQRFAAARLPVLTSPFRGRGALDVSYPITPKDMTKSNPPAAEQRLRSYLAKQPEFSIAWEIRQHGEYSWDRGVLDWARSMAQAVSFFDLYGMAAQDDFDPDAFVSTHGQFDECLALLRANLADDDAPRASSEDFIFRLYFFGMKRRTLEILDHLGIDY